ncbi:E3 ubiquitin-protein ligase TRIM71, partial [Acropora cervicornis]
MAFQGHKVTPVKQFQDKDYAAMLKRQSFCSQQYHEREPTRFYCTECEMCVCQICINTIHKHHGVELLEKAVESAKDEIQRLAEMTKERITTCDASIRQLEEMEAEMEANVASSKRKVSRAADQIVAKARGLERDNITALENRRLSSAQKFHSAKQQIQSFAKQFTQVIDFAKEIVQISSCSDIIQSHQQIESRFRDLDKTPIPPLPACSSAMFVQTCNPSSLELGFTTTTDVDVNESPVNGLNQEFQAGVEGTLVVRPRIHPEEGVTEAANTKIYVQVLMEPVEKVSSMDVFDQGDGSYEVKFVAKVPGCLKVTVKINNKELANSPFTVHVRERRIQVFGELEFVGKVPEHPSGIAVNGEGLIAVRNFVKSFGKEGTGTGEFKYPSGVCMIDSGNIVIADTYNNRVQFLTDDGKHLLTFGENGVGKVELPVRCIYWWNTYIVSSCKNHFLNVFDCRGKFLCQIGKSGAENRQLPRRLWGFCIEGYRNHQNLLVSDIKNGCIYQFTTDNCFTGKTVAKLGRVPVMTAAPDGRILAF